MWFKKLFSGNYMGWEEYKDMIDYRDIILFFDSVTKTNIRNEVKNEL